MITILLKEKSIRMCNSEKSALQTIWGACGYDNMNGLCIKKKVQKNFIIRESIFLVKFLTSAQLN